ncbi:MFS transporter [Vineibacter terrae]|uniref:MFS transporter n=1 Tax=Vineibacter terrae TaxID=2586908 RepID=UPI001C49BC05|nr:MFS transporter [Vineibacter terrae]
MVALPIDAGDGLPVPRRHWAVAAMAFGLSMTVLNGSLANIALPVIARDLDTTAARSIWIVNAFQIAVMVSLLPLSSLGDVLGYRRVFRAGVVVFTLASLICALSDSLTMLVIARTVQGLGAAGIMSVNPALIRFTYPRAALGHGMGINALIVATSAALGPTAAAAILALGPWQWLFAIAVPMGVVSFALSARALPVTEPTPHPFDLPSALLSALSFGLLIGGIDGIGHGHGALVVTAELALAVILGTVFVVRQKALPAPMLPVDIFRRPVFSLSVVSSVCSFTAQGAAFVALPFYLQDVLGLTQVDTGLLMTPWPVAVGVMAPLAGRLSDRYPAGLLGGLGLTLLCAGLLLMAFLPPQPSHIDIAWRMAICGAGFGLFQSPNNRILIGSVPRERSGAAGGVLSTARVMGQTLGAALVALVFGLVVTQAAGPTVALLISAGFAGVAVFTSTMRLARFSGDV